MQTYPIERLLPHRNPMILIDGYIPEHTTDESIETYVEITPGSPFYEPRLSGVPGVFALEYIAQTLACLIGLRALESGKTPSIGYVIGARRLGPVPVAFLKGCRYFLRGTIDFSDGAFASFSCSMHDDTGAKLLDGTISCYRPPPDTAPER